ncbi:MAG: PP2C family serine/threonine-protein phosphatase [Litorilinea sp.]
MTNARPAANNSPLPASSAVSSGISTAGRSPWWAIGASARGASHVRGDRPNQDALAWRTHGDAVLLALADGHGSARYIRSHQGAKIAVQVALTQLEQFLQQHHNPATLKRRAEEQLPRTLVRAWQDAVAAQLVRVPLSQAETDTLARIMSTDEQAALAARPQRIFGATLLAAIVTPTFGLFLQLGDGDILTVEADGTVARLPLVEDARLFANQTTSLAGTRAWQDMRVHFQPFVRTAPALILFATDGYGNSFQDESGLFAAAADLHTLLHSQGRPYIRRHLKSWLVQTSELGSGDDISVGLIARPVIQRDSA